MAGELNTEVRDDPAGCRSLADWLAALRPGVARIGDAVYRQRGESESFWQGTAAEACRRELTTQGEDGDSLEKLIGDTCEGLRTFSDRIDGVHQRMRTAQENARAGGLVVTPTAILPPGPAPGAGPAPLPSGPVLPGARAEHDAAASAHTSAVARFEEQGRAFEEATAAVDEARSAQADAHVDLDKAMRDPLEKIKQLKLYGMFIVGNGLSYIKTAQTNADDFLEKAGRLDRAASTMQMRAESMVGSPAMREMAEKAAERGKQLSAETFGQYQQTQRLNEKVPAGARRFIEANPGNPIKGATAAGRIGRSVLRGVPYVGTGIAVASAGADVAMGKDPWNAAGDTAASLGGSIGGGLACGAAVGSVFPGVGTAVGGVIGGIAGGIVATGVVDLIQGDS